MEQAKQFTRVSFDREIRLKTSDIEIIKGYLPIVPGVVKERYLCAMNNREDIKIVKELSFNFNDDGGFVTTIVYEELKCTE